MKFGCCVGIERYNDLIKIGYDFIELAGSAVYKMTEQEFKRAKDTIMNGSIKCPGFNAFLSPDIKVVGDCIDQEKIDEYVDKVILRGVELEIETIGFGSPLSRIIPEGFSREKAIEQVVEFVGRVLKKCEPYGIKVLIEPLNKTETNFINSTKEALEILKILKGKNTGLLLDLYHFSMENEDIEKINHQVAENICHAHIAEKQGRTYLIPSCLEKYKRLIDRLKWAGYSSKLSIEGNFKDFFSEASTSLKILKEIDGELC